MNFLFDEDTPPIIVKVLRFAFSAEEDKEFHHIVWGNADFHAGMQDPEIMQKIATKGWCILGYDKFRGHPIDVWAKQSLVIRLHRKELKERPIPEQCWKFVKVFHTRFVHIKKQNLGVVYTLSHSGKLSPVNAGRKKKRKRKNGSPLQT